MLLLGYDIGTSSIKATLMDSESQKVLASAISPKKEMEIIAAKPGWAEQHPQSWWDNVVKATAELMETSGADVNSIEAIGITYQMHGLVAVDEKNEPLRPSIIWCDSRAVEEGNKAAEKIGRKKCLENLLNYPGNFTAMKLKWVMENEPDIFSRIKKIMLPGDYIAMLMTGKAVTTVSGLSEGILWDFKNGSLSEMVIDYLGTGEEIIPDCLPTFSIQGELTKDAAQKLGQDRKSRQPIFRKQDDFYTESFAARSQKIFNFVISACRYMIKAKKTVALKNGCLNHVSLNLRPPRLALSRTWQIVIRVTGKRLRAE